MLTRKQKRMARAAGHRASILSQVTGIPHSVRADRYCDRFYPISDAAKSKLIYKGRTSAFIRCITITQDIKLGRPKYKRKIRYTRIPVSNGRVAKR